ncbi:MAG: cell division protein SepF [Actinomycetes bacterium]|jgi:cell division inhibitor SepF
MANAFKKMAGFLGLVEEEELEIESTQVVAEPRRSVRPLPSATPSWAQNAPAVTTLPGRSAPTAQQRELPIMDRIITIHPRFYNEARNIGEHYREGQPVIMNLSDMEESERKRLVDFASGLVFGHHGSIERVTSKVFLLTPPNVMVSVEDKTAAAEASFFNQS